MQANEREQHTALFPQCTARTDAVHCRSGCTALRKRLQCTAGKGYIMAYSNLHYRLQISLLADKRPILWRTALQAAFVVCYLYRGRCPRLLKVVPSRHQSASGLYFTTDLTNRTDSGPIWEQNINQKNPLERMDSVALMLCFRSGLIRASS